MKFSMSLHWWWPRGWSGGVRDPCSLLYHLAVLQGLINPKTLTLYEWELCFILSMLCTYSYICTYISHYHSFVIGGSQEFSFNSIILTCFAFSIQLFALWENYAVVTSSHVLPHSDFYRPHSLNNYTAYSMTMISYIHKKLWKKYRKLEVLFQYHCVFCY